MPVAVACGNRSRGIAVDGEIASPVILDQVRAVRAQHLQGGRGPLRGPAVAGRVREGGLRVHQLGAARGEGLIENRRRRRARGPCDRHDPQTRIPRRRDRPPVRRRLHHDGVTGRARARNAEAIPLWPPDTTRTSDAVGGAPPSWTARASSGRTMSAGRADPRRAAAAMRRGRARPARGPPAPRPPATGRRWGSCREARWRHRAWAPSSSRCAPAPRARRRAPSSATSSRRGPTAPRRARSFRPPAASR